MSSERIVGLFSGVAVSVILGALVLASFVVPLSPAPPVASREGPIVALLVADDERAAPAARGFPRVRDESPVEIASPVAPATASTAEPTVAAEARMLTLMNASRAEAGLVPLVIDANVVAAARTHSAVEAAYRYVYHDGPDGTARSRDATACGTGWYGENTGKVWQENVDRLHIEFMSEPWEPINHRTNVMDPQFRRVGIGAVQGNDALYMTMVFCR